MTKADYGRRAICGRCDLEIERITPLWHDRGGNRRCNLPGSPLHLAAGENVWTLLSATPKRHARAICGDNVTGSNVRGIKKILNHVWRLEKGYSGNRSTATPEEAATIRDLIAERQPLVTGDLVASGIKLLQSRRYAKRLASYPVAQVDGFRLIGWDEIGNGNHVPIYRALIAGKPAFAFRNVAWQSGGDGPEIML